jgi:hypothetical protein
MSFMKGNKVHRSFPCYSTREDVVRAIRRAHPEELILLPLGVGEYFPDWKFAQHICLLLVDSPEENIRANACLGLSYIARTKQKLEQHLVKPVLLRELKLQNLLRWRVLDAIKDINHYLGWNIRVPFVYTAYFEKIY